MPHCKNLNNPSHCLERNCETLRPWRQNLPRVKSPPLSRNNWRRMDFVFVFVFVFVFTFVFVFEPEQLERVRFCRFSPLWRRFLVKLCFPRSPGKLMWWRRLQPWRRWWRRRRLPSSPTHGQKFSLTNLFLISQRDGTTAVSVKNLSKNSLYDEFFIGTTYPLSEIGFQILFL